jgi:hypothetical protein
MLLAPYQSKQTRGARPLLGSRNWSGLLFSGAECDQRHLFKCWVVPLCIRFAIAGCNLLNCGLCWQSFGEVFSVDLVEQWAFGEIVEIDGGVNNVIEAEAGFFQIVEEIAHGLASLIGCRSKVDTAVGTWNESTLR